MKPFLNSKEAARKREARALACNPAPNRSPKHYQRITRTLALIEGRIAAYLDATDYAPLEWLPFVGAVHEKDDEWQADLYAQVHPDDHNPDHDGYLVEWTDPGIKATNRIMAVTWYEDAATGDAFIIKKPVLCPLPCPNWGRLPVTLHQWRPIAMTLIASEARWRWVHAVRRYLNNPNMQLQGVAGWHLEPTKAVTSVDKLVKAGKGYVIDMRPNHEQDTNEWIGANICLDIIAGFSLDD